MQTAVFSIVSPNYRHYARVLMASVVRNHPEWDRFVLVVGGAAKADDGEEPFTAIPVEALPLPNARQFYFRYTILELNTAVKPWMFEYLFARGYERVVFLDPDIFVYTPLVELDAASPETFLTLTPHLTGSIGGDLHPSERTILLAGSNNLGFLSVTRQSALERFLGWWKEKLEFQCVVDVARGIFVDQKWMDLAPGLFPGVSILRHDGYNVAYWNLRQRTVRIDGSAATANGEALRFFHFSGVDPDVPELISKHDTRMRPQDFGDVGKLITEYSAALHVAGYDAFKRAPYAFGVFVDGTPVSDIARIAYRNSPALQKACGADPFQHPDLFNGMVEVHATPPLTARLGVVSYRMMSRARPLVGLIPKRLRTSAREFLLGRARQKAQTAQPESPLRAGLNIVGYVDRPSGVGESARLCRVSCEAAGLPSHVIDVDRTGGVAHVAAHRATVYHVNADQTLAVRAKLANVFEASAYNIGCWHWELPELPDAWIAAAEPLNEIWAPSAFVQATVSRKVTIPVVHMPHGIEVTNVEPCSPQELGVPAGRFTFLCMFDFDSVMERKNPYGAIEAFRRAFAHDSSVALLVKTAHASDHPAEYAALQEKLCAIPNVYLTDRMLSRARVNGLLDACDGVVSLHRSEGFGLILAEAMYLGRPVVATAWSGNMDFMNSGNSCPVGYDLVTLDRTHLYYEAGQQWAEPDVEHAAELMRRLVEDDSYRARIAARGRETIRSHFSPEAAGKRYRKRLEFLGLMSGESPHPF